MNEPYVLIPLVLLVIVGIRLAAGALDRKRLVEYVESRGGRLIDTTWEPFGPGWFGEKSDRIYSVHYRDRDGNEHRAHCKTSMWTGVYFTQDSIVKRGGRDETDAPRAAPRESLEEENRRLREELDKLKRQQSGSGSGAEP